MTAHDNRFNRPWRRHPAFLHVAACYESDEGTAVVVRYREDHPAYEGGLRVEVYDDDGAFVSEHAVDSVGDARNTYAAGDGGPVPVPCTSDTPEGAFQKARVQKAVEAFPRQFGLSYFPGQTFSIKAEESHVDEWGKVQLAVYNTDTLRSHNKRTARNLRRQIAPAPGRSDAEEA